MSTHDDEAATETTTEKKRGRAIVGVLLGLPLIALAVTVPTAVSARSDSQMTAKRVSAVATVTTADFRVALVAERLGGGAAPAAEVRAAVAQRVGSAWRERSELRLPETYFWRTVTGPRAVCRLEIATGSSPTGSRPHVTIQLLQSPSLGCAPSHRVALPAR